jgi:hypothetical protein
MSKENYLWSKEHFAELYNLNIEMSRTIFKKIEEEFKRRTEIDSEFSYEFTEHSIHDSVSDESIILYYDMENDCIVAMKYNDIVNSGVVYFDICLNDLIWILDHLLHGEKTL